MAWGFLRESEQVAKGIDRVTGLNRTGFDKYAEVIFPTTDDWIHDKMIPNSGRRVRPDWRSESLKIVIEFDGVQHYQNPQQILNDRERSEFYKGLGYKVVRIPFFIQLSNSAVKTLFDIDVKQPLFDEEKYPSMNIEERCTPAFMCPAGIQRMADEFRLFPVQYRVNLKYLKSCNDEFLTAVTELETAYNKLISSY